jgi:Mce-associated membrane protein
VTTSAETESAPPPPTTPTGPSSGAPNGRFRVVLLVVLVLALLVSGGVLVWLLADRRGDADGVQSDREAVMSQVEQFVLRLNTYGPDQLDDQGHMPEYEKQVTAVITPKFAADFEKSGLPIAEQTVAEAGLGRTAKVFGVGVDSIDGDSATAIVAAGLNGSSADPKHPNDTSKRIPLDPAVLRWSVALVKVDGKWLVDDYTPVTGEDAQ